MKPFLFKINFLVLFILPISLLATVHTVSNSPSTLAQFNNIQTAVNTAANGDTIYVHGSPNVYAAFTQTNKQLTFIGPGWSPDKNSPLRAIIAGCTITGASCANSEYQGLVFTSTISINTTKPDNLRFMRNQFFNLSLQLQQTSVTYSGYLFEGNMFENSGVDGSGSAATTYQNFLFLNNWFYENATIRSGNFSGFLACVNVLFDHNLWYGPGGGERDCFSGNTQSLNLSNNIFVRRNASTSNSNSTFQNNITFYPPGSNAPAVPWTVNGNVNGGGNVDNQNPQMANQVAVNAGSNSPISDYSIAAGPANNTATDGKDMGFLFDATGSLNWANSRNSRLPRIFSMNVITPSIPAGGNVTINIDARISN